MTFMDVNLQGLVDLAYKAHEADNKHLNLKELLILYQFLEHQHISYENYDMIVLMRKISAIIDREK